MGASGIDLGPRPGHKAETIDMKPKARGYARGLGMIAIIAIAGLIAGAARAAPGDLDPTFGVGGVSAVPGGGAYETLLVQPDGKILAGGFVSNSGLYFATVARFDEDGTLDPAFGTAGVATFAYGDQYHGGEVFTLELQPDGKILAGGTTNARFGLARLNGDGSLDTSFGTNGISTPDTGEGVILDLALQPDGSVYAVGRLGPVFNFSPPGNQLGLVRFQANGAVDPGFGTDGVVAADFANGNIFTALFRSDGSVLAGGTTYTFSDFQLAGYTSDGELDTGFGTAGYAYTDFSGSDVIQSLAVQPDGAIVAAGASINRGDDFALARYTPNGMPDIGFGQGGKLETEFSLFDQALAYAVAVQPDGKIVAAGCAQSCNTLAIARYNVDGSLDAGFGQGGLTVGSAIAEVSAIVLQQDGRIVASAGGHYLLAPDGNTLARFTVGAQAAAEQVGDLIRIVNGYQLGKLGTSLQDKLETVQLMLAANKPKPACANLRSFLSQIRAQTGKGLTVEQADEITRSGGRIETAIGC
jgi:uncharacterized delta-60 repeat protein